MPIDANRAYLLTEACRGRGLRGTAVLTLGVKHVEGVSDPFRELGYSHAESIDNSDFEGATHIADLNSTTLPDKLKERFGLIYNGGTLEHIFDTRAALKNLYDMLVPGGIVVHVGPMNGWVDHGFYQFSPTFFSDYYFANKHEALAAYLLRAINQDHSDIEVRYYVPGMLDNGRAGTLDGLWNFFMVFVKIPGSTCGAIPQQSYYTRIYGDDSAVAVHPNLIHRKPIRLINGMAQPLQFSFNAKRSRDRFAKLFKRNR